MNDIVTRCARHPNVETSLRCGRCDAPICARCMVMSPVGQRCRDCGAPAGRRAGLRPASAVEWAKGLGIALLFGVGVTIAWGAIPFLGLIVAAFAGYSMGETLRRVNPGLRGLVPIVCVLVAALTALLAGAAFFTIATVSNPHVLGSHMSVIALFVAGLVNLVGLLEAAIFAICGIVRVR